MIKILVALTLILTLNGYLALRIIARSAWAQQHMPTVWGITAVFFILQLIGPFGDHLFFPTLRMSSEISMTIKIVDWISYCSLGLLSCLFLYNILIDIFSLVWRLFPSGSDPINFDRRALITLGAVSLGTMAIGIHETLSGPIIKRIDIPLKNLPPSFDGFTIAQISDLHVGSLIDRKYTENVVRLVNGLKPNLVALTGDFIDGTVDQLQNDVAPLADLEATHGIFYITGNHEYYWGADAWIEKFKSLGAKFLGNEHVIIRQKSDEIVLAGVTDYSTLHMDSSISMNPKKSLEGAPQGRVKILLAHQPASYRLAYEAGFDLQLSGHTHAGQYIPFKFIVALFQRYYQGLNRHETMWVYVNSGTGYWGPPLRGGVPSEITLITLRPEGYI